MSSAKKDILARVRTALGPSPVAPEIPRAYRHAGTLPHDGIVDLFRQRVAEYQATVHCVPAADVARIVCTILVDAERIGVPVGFPDLGVDVIADDSLSIADLDTLDAVVTGSALAIADTGTIILDSGPSSGRRALTLIPDHHVCIVDAHTIVPFVPDAVAQLAAAAAEGRPITLISGPSATSDIELDRVEGVHGPRRLDVIVTT
jgi:L-lactate dehydrogenase complex protein LldG